MRGKITKRTVDALSLRNGAETVLWDQEVKGFGVRARSGGKSYILHYRAGTGRAAPVRKFTIGRHGSPWTPEQARTEAKRLLGLVASGIDPAFVRATQRTIPTLAEVGDLYMEEGTSHKKPSTLRNDRSRLKLHIKPLLGRKRVDQVTRGDVERLLIDVQSGLTAAGLAPVRRRPGGRTTGGKGTAAQCVALLSTILGFAAARGLRPDNPARGVKKPPTRKLERFLSADEIAKLAVVLSAEASETNDPYPAAAIRLLLLTGARRGEILGLKWDYVDLERHCLRLPDSKTGAKVIYLSPPALELLTSLPRQSDNPHVFPGKRTAGGIVGIDKIWFRVRASAGLQNVRLHDLRHSFASMGAGGGLSLPVIGALLGHKHATTTARYAHLSADPLRAANDFVGKRIAEAMAGGVTDEADKVVPLPTPISRRG